MKGTKRKRAAKSPATPVADVIVSVAQDVAEISSPVPMVDAAPVIEPELVIADLSEVAQPALVSSFLALNAACTVRDAGELRSSLLALIDTDAAVTLDVGAVERIDTAALQVLAAFSRDRRDKERTTSWANVNPTFAEAANVLGLATILGLTALQVEVAPL